MPPTERRGRVHTSTVTVSVVDLLPEQLSSIDLSKVVFKTTRGSGSGGQNRNKVETVVIASYDGITVRCETERSQKQNKDTALSILAAKVRDRKLESDLRATNEVRRQQIGSGMRGDKIRTYREQDDQVVDHRTGKRCRLRDFTRGNLRELW